MCDWYVYLSIKMMRVFFNFTLVFSKQPHTGKHIASFDGSSGDKKQNAQACEYFTSALELDTSSEIALISLARLYILDKKAEDCEKMCRTLLRINPTHRQASVILADALSMKNDATQDVFHFTQLLKSKPDNFVLLARVISLLWRSGKLDSAKRLLDRAKHVSHEASHSAGYHFCQGLYYRFATEPNKAIKYLNLARRDGEWGRRAIEMMVRVYISPGGTSCVESVYYTRSHTDLLTHLLTHPPLIHTHIQASERIFGTNNHLRTIEVKLKKLRMLSSP